MALAAQATKLSMDATKRPSGYTDPGGSNLANAQPVYQNLKLSITKSVVANATKSTTFNNIRTNATIGIEKQIADKLGAEFDDSANTITYNIDWKDVQQNFTFPEHFYTNDVAVFYAIVDVYVVIS